MAGLISANILRPELASSFATGYQQAEEQRNRLATQAQQREVAQFNLDRAKEDYATMRQLQQQLVAAGKDPDMGKVADALIASGNPNYMLKGMELKQRYADALKYEDFVRTGTLGTPRVQAAPAMPTTGTAAMPVPPPTSLTVTPLGEGGLPAPTVPAQGAMPAARWTGTTLPAAQVNALRAQANAGDLDAQNMLRAYDAATAPVAAAGPAPMPREAQIRAEMANLEQRQRGLKELRDPRAKQELDLIEKKLTRLQTELGWHHDKPSEVQRLVSALQDPSLTPEARQTLQNRIDILTTRADKAEPAPVITEVSDPNNPNQNLRIDARAYKGGSVGSPGVIGVSGKSAAVVRKEQERDQGLQTFNNIMDSLETAYTTLDIQRAIPSTQRNAISNILSSIAATGLGQAAGRAVGTPEQVQRDIIKSVRNQLLNAIKNATGMAAGQLNSNVELQTWISSLTDPSVAIEANTVIMENLRKFVDSGGKYSAKKDAKGTEASGAIKPPPGFNLDK